MTNANYQRCSQCIMDTSDPDIVFDELGECNHCKWYYHKRELCVFGGKAGESSYAALAEKIRLSGRGKNYDCVMGISGGIDSSYLALLAKRLGLRPLVVHLDNGWNSEVSTYNINNLVERLGFDLVTKVINWNEFRSLQRAFFSASVVDIEMLTDHAIKATILEQAQKYGIRYVLSGGNVVTEAIMPVSWRHAKSDLKNIKAIVRRHGPVRMQTYPAAGTLRQWFIKYSRRIQTVMPLNLIDYDPSKALLELQDAIDFRPYGKKHTESVFTRFYQGYILPKKFNIDKRLPHLSNLVCGDFVTRDEALAEVAKPAYDPLLLQQDIEYVEKKLGFSHSEFEAYLSAPGKSHFEYASDQPMVRKLIQLRQRYSRAA